MTDICRQSDESTVIIRNRVFMSTRKALINELTKAMFSDTAKNYKKNSSEPPTADEVAHIFEETIGGKIISPEFAALCMAFSHEYGAKLINFKKSDSDIDVPKIAYLQNTFSDRAYSRFANSFTKVSAIYFPGFREVCEEVYNGSCSYAILPISNSSDGFLTSFRRLISKYDLWIALATDIEMNDDSLMRFALLMKSSEGWFCSTVTQKMNYLDLSIVLDSSEYGAFLSACDTLGATVLMMNSLPLEYSDDRFALTLQFDISKADTDAMFFFLEGSHIRYDIVGIYDIINN